MDIVVFILGLIFMLFLVPAILTWDVDTFDEAPDKPTFRGRPPGCDIHHWVYNEYGKLQCMRCGKTPGELN